MNRSVIASLSAAVKSGSAGSSALTPSPFHLRRRPDCWRAAPTARDMDRGLTQLVLGRAVEVLSVSE